MYKFYAYYYSIYISILTCTASIYTIILSVCLYFSQFFESEPVQKVQCIFNAYMASWEDLQHSLYTKRNFCRLSFRSTI